MSPRGRNLNECIVLVIQLSRNVLLPLPGRLSYSRLTRSKGKYSEAPRFPYRNFLIFYCPLRASLPRRRSESDRFNYETISPPTTTALVPAIKSRNYIFIFHKQKGTRAETFRRRRRRRPFSGTQTAGHNAGGGFSVTSREKYVRCRYREIMHRKLRYRGGVSILGKFPLRFGEN